MPKYHLDSRFHVLIICTVILLCLSFLFPYSLTRFKVFFVEAFLFPAKVFSLISREIKTKSLYVAENKALRKNAAELALKISQYQDLRDENARLRKLLSLKEKTKFDTVSAEAIGRDPNRWMEFFMIDKGYTEGVRSDAAVCSAKGLLGKVAEAYDHTSSVIMLTHPAFKCGGMIAETRVHGVVEGTSGGTIRMIYLPVEIRMRRGMVVVTSDKSFLFPKDIPIGEIVSFGKSKDGLYKYAVLRPFAGYADQEEVLCVKWR